MLVTRTQKRARLLKSTLFVSALGVLAACGADTTRDFGLSPNDLSAMKAGIWVDPNGCEHWMIDDGAEGYLTPRVRPNGTPVCRDL